MFIFSFLLNSAAVLGFSRLPPFIKKYIAAHPRSGDGLLEILEGKFEGHPLSLLEETTTPTCLNGGTLSEDGASCACATAAYSSTDCSVVCASHGTLDDSGKCTCSTGYSGVDCSLSQADQLNQLATYCAASPNMESLGAAGVELNNAEAALRSLCPPPASSS